MRDAAHPVEPLLLILVIGLDRFLTATTCSFIAIKRVVTIDICHIVTDYVKYSPQIPLVFLSFIYNYFFRATLPNVI